MPLQTARAFLPRPLPPGHNSTLAAAAAAAVYRIRWPHLSGKAWPPRAHGLMMFHYGVGGSFYLATPGLLLLRSGSLGGEISAGSGYFSGGRDVLDLGLGSSGGCRLISGFAGRLLGDAGLLSVSGWVSFPRLSGVWVIGVCWICGRPD